MTIAIYGGTFNPIHIGHLRAAIEIKSYLGANEVRLVPSSTPPHRQAPDVSVADRVHMIQLAIDGLEGIHLDDREIKREGVSYSIDTLREIAEELIAAGRGDEPRFFILGQDAFDLIDTWQDWQSLTDYANLVVMQRPGFRETKLPKPVVEWVKDKQVSTLGSQVAGKIVYVKLPQIEVSASDIRQRHQQNLPIDFLVPEAVRSYIKSQGLYQ